MGRLKYFMSNPIIRGIAIAVMVSLVLVGGVSAAYQFWAGTASVTVNEAMAVYVDAQWRDTNTYTWAVTAFPGAIVTKSFIVRNNGTASLTITPNATKTSGDDGITPSWDKGATLVLPGSGSQQTFVLSLTVAGDANPGERSFAITFERN